MLGQLLITIWGLLLAYERNGKEQGIELVSRIIALSFPLSIKVLLGLIAAQILIVARLGEAYPLFNEALMIALSWLFLILLYRQVGMYLEQIQTGQKLSQPQAVIAVDADSVTPQELPQQDPAPTTKTAFIQEL